MTKTIATLAIIASLLSAATAAQAADATSDFAVRFFAERALNGS